MLVHGQPGVVSVIVTFAPVNAHAVDQAEVNDVAPNLWINHLAQASSTVASVSMGLAIKSVLCQ